MNIKVIRALPYFTLLFLTQGNIALDIRCCLINILNVNPLCQEVYYKFNLIFFIIYFKILAITP